MPAVAVILLGPSAVALTFFFFVLAKPMPPVYNRKQFVNKILISCIFIFVAVLALATVAKRGSAQIVSEGLRYNCQLKAVMYFLSSESGWWAKTDLANATRKIPAFDQIELALKPQRTNHNVVIVILEGIQYSYTSLADASGNLTPYLATLAGQGVLNLQTPVQHLPTPQKFCLAF
jgi:glucan phosphoethanolaminetransferase (alkaline phosphatase superfamily)